MDIKRIQYNQNLLSKKYEVEKEMTSLDRNLTIQQEICNHIFVTTGFVGDYLDVGTAITECLFCAKVRSFEKNDLATSINATNYKSDQYGQGNIKKQRMDRLTELQNLWIKYLEEDQTLSEEELIQRLKSEIESDKLKKVYKK